MTTLLNPYFGEFGGMYVPQILMPALNQLEEAFVSAQKDPEFQAQFADLLHKTNQVLGQALLAKRMGKSEIIAETGAGQHGVASALASALLGLKCRKSLKIIDTLIDAGANALELGVPFSDPLADGPTIQNAAFYARCEQVGVDSVLVADVPVEESAPFRQAALRQERC